jgi:hypothetical protein
MMNPPRRAPRALLAAALLLCGCASVDVVRIQPDLLKTPEGTEPLAGIQARCTGFYLFTLGIPEATLDKVINEMLLKKARELGADRIINLQFDATPSHGWWWITKLLWWRSASATAIAVVKEHGADATGRPPPLELPPMPSEPASRPAAE